MRSRYISILFCILLLVGCRATYTYENIQQSIIDICKKEYDTDVLVKRTGRTVGIYVPINGIFESTIELQKKATIEDVLAGIRFTKEAAKKIDDVSLVITRAALSTDAPVDFYVLIIADTKGSGIEVVVVRYIMDIKRLMLGDVSRGDYIQRILMNIDFNSTPGAEEFVKGLFYDMQLLSRETIINRYFSKDVNTRTSSANFFVYLSELSYKQKRNFFIVNLDGVQIEKGKVIIRCKVRETYLPMGGYENFKFLYPSGFQNEYLILVDVSSIPYQIEEVQPLYFIGANGAIEKLPYPEQFAKYKKYQTADTGDFYLEEVQFPDFLAQQLANRVRALYQSDPRLNKVFTINLIKGEYQPDLKNFKVMFDIEKKKEEINLNDMWNVISKAMRRYNFNDFNSVELFDIANAKSQIMRRDDLLRVFWPKWLLRK